MLITLLSIVASVFPERWRRRWFQDADLDVKRGAVFSGLAQIFVPGLTLWLRYPAYYNAQLAAAYGAVQGRGGPDHIREGFAGFALGPLTMFQYILTPLNLLLIYWCAEGGIRLMATLVTGEVVPTLPLQLAAWAQGLGAVHAREMALGERVPDEVLQLEGKHALAIASCRPKDWDHLITIRYKESCSSWRRRKKARRRGDSSTCCGRRRRTRSCAG